MHKQSFIDAMRSYFDGYSVLSLYTYVFEIYILFIHSKFKSFDLDKMFASIIVAHTSQTIDDAHKQIRLYFRHASFLTYSCEYVLKEQKKTESPTRSSDVSYATDSFSIVWRLHAICLLFLPPKTKNDNQQIHSSNTKQSRDMSRWKLSAKDGWRMSCVIFKTDYQRNFWCLLIKYSQTMIAWQIHSTQKYQFELTYMVWLFDLF